MNICFRYTPGACLILNKKEKTSTVHIHDCIFNKEHLYLFHFVHM